MTHSTVEVSNKFSPHQPFLMCFLGKKKSYALKSQLEQIQQEFLARAGDKASLNAFITAGGLLMLDRWRVSGDFLNYKFRSHCFHP